MTDEKPKPIEDLKQGLGLLFRAAKNVAGVAAEKLPSGKFEEAARDAAREVGRALETVGEEIDKAFHKATGSTPAARNADASAPPPSAPTTQGSPKVAPEPHDDAYAPAPSQDGDGSRGPRVG